MTTDEELLLQSTYAPVSYQVGEPDIPILERSSVEAGPILPPGWPQVDLDVYAPGEVFDHEDAYGKWIVGEGGELRGRPAGEYFKDKALEYGEWFFAATSIPDPTVVSDIIWAKIKVLQDEPELAALGLGLAAAGAGVASGAWAVQAGKLKPALSRLYSARGLRPDEASALAGKVIGEAGRSKQVVESMSGMARPGYGYFTHSVGGGSQGGRLHAGGGIEGVSRGVSEHGILFSVRHYETSTGIVPFMNYIGHAPVSGPGINLGEQLVKMATQMPKTASRWIGEAPVTFIVELPLKAGVPKAVGHRTGGYYITDTILASGKSLDAPGMGGARQMARYVEEGGGTFQSGGWKKGSKGLTHTIPPEHIKGVLVNGEIISFAEYMRRLKPARPGKSRWRTE